MKNQPLRVLVPLHHSIVHCSGLGIIKAIALSGISCVVHSLAPSRTVAGLYLVDSYDICPALDDPEYMDWIIEYCREHRIDVIMPDGVDIRRFAGQRDRILKNCGSVVLAQPGPVIDLTENKLSMSVWLKDQGFPHPRFGAGGDAVTLKRLVAEAGFPLIAKPVYGVGSCGVRLIPDERALECPAHDPDMLVQEYVGDEDNEYTVCCFVDKEGVLRGSFIFRRRLWQGVSVSCEVDRNQAVLEAAEKISLSLGARGSINIQMRLHHGVPVCLEVNARFSGTVGMRAKLGFNDVGMSLRHFILGKPCEPMPVIKKGVAIRTFDEVYP